MSMIRPIADLDDGDHIVVDSGHASEIAAGTYTVTATETVDGGRVRLTLTPDDDGDPVVGEYDGGIEVEVN